MDESTEGVTLYAGFIFDLLSCYEETGSVARELYGMAEELDREQPTALVPIELYNKMCTWIENEFGPANLRRAGVAIGERAYSQMVEVQGLTGSVSPTQILQGLRQAADAMIQDAKGRGWAIRETSNGRVLIRRTQTFNCLMQEGLLQSLVKKTGVLLPRVDHVRCTRKGDEFCEYEVTWMTS
jgi:hypothetical protein